ncbi:MAG: hypothetical protein ACRDKI_11740 [Solirubrobacterales bacterium]
MLDSAEILLVRRLRAGDVEALAPLYERSSVPLRRFCGSLVGDVVGARRAADGAFAFAVERLAARPMNAQQFRSTLLVEARVRCYDEISAAVAGDGGSRPEDFDIDDLRERIAALHPDADNGKGLALSWRDKLPFGKAAVLAVMMVLMIDLFVAGGYPLPRIFGGGGHDRSAKQAAPAAPAATTTKARAAKHSATKARAKAHARRAHTKSQSKAPSSGGGGSQQNGSASNSGSDHAAKDPPAASPPAVPPVDVNVDLPDLQLPVDPQVQVEAGPINVNVKGQDISACVTAICVNTK